MNGHMDTETNWKHKREYLSMLSTHFHVIDQPNDTSNTQNASPECI